MKEEIIHFDRDAEYYTPEGCYIVENLNSPNDPRITVAQARVEPGVVTRWHFLKDTVERYVILEGTGRVEIGDLPAAEVEPGDVVLIPPGSRQRIANIGEKDLVFHCICTPGFRQEAYVDIDVTAPMTPFALALLSYVKGVKDATVLIRREDGFCGPLPASHFFREETELSTIETAAISHCRGHVLDIGAGSGIHSLILQSRGFAVTAIDISPELVSLMAGRGVKDARQADVFNYPEKGYDTLLMLGHGIGIAGDLSGLDKFLSQAKKLVIPGGQILLESTDVAVSTDPKHLAYHESNRKAGRYIGDICFRMEFAGITGPYLHWLHVDPRTLAERAERSGWNCEALEKMENGDYLARMWGLTTINC